MYAESAVQISALAITEQTASRGETVPVDPSVEVDRDPDALPEPGEKWQLKKLSQKHKDVCALIAQGLGRGQIAGLCGITPEYVTMLTKQPLCIAFIKEMNEYAGLQLEAMFTKVVDVVAEGLQSGTIKDKLQAARLQMEVTGRVGSKNTRPNDDAGMEDRLLNLSERLVGLLANAKASSGHQTIEDAEFKVIGESDD